MMCRGKQIRRCWQGFGLLALLLLSLAGGCANRMFYQPERFMRPSPETREIRTEAVEFDAPDGVRLTGWWLPAEEPAKGLVVHFHGNAQNMSTHVRFAEWLPAAGYHLLVFDYRGYGLSEGVPSRAGLVRDGVAALRWAEARVEHPEEELFIWGQSLGGTVAVHALLESGVSVRGIILDSTFTNHTRIGAEILAKLPLLLQPLRLFRPLLFTSGWDAKDAVPLLGDTPVLFLHGESDPVISPRHSLDLYRLAPGPRHLCIIPGAGHCDAVLRFPEQTRPLLLAFLQDPTQKLAVPDK